MNDNDSMQCWLNLCSVQNEASSQLEAQGYAYNLNCMPFSIGDVVCYYSAKVQGEIIWCVVVGTADDEHQREWAWSAVQNLSWSIESHEIKYGADKEIRIVSKYDLFKAPMFRVGSILEVSVEFGNSIVKVETDVMAAVCEPKDRASQCDYPWSCEIFSGQLEVSERILEYMVDSVVKW